MLEQVPLSRLGLLARVRARNMVMMVVMVVMVVIMMILVMMVVVMMIMVMILIRGGGGDVYIVRNTSTKAKICRRRLTMTF